MTTLSQSQHSLSSSSSSVSPPHYDLMHRATCNNPPLACPSSVAPCPASLIARTQLHGRTNSFLLTHCIPLLPRTLILQEPLSFLSSRITTATQPLAYASARRHRQPGPTPCSTAAVEPLLASRCSVVIATLLPCYLSLTHGSTCSRASLLNAEDSCTLLSHARFSRLSSCFDA